ncbi:MAG: small multidrug resistance protein [Bryobacterales bacterium]|nr:small multidrug resistance protein [Bryobacterales bacterium]
MKWFLVMVLVAATTAGDVFRSMGMKHHGEIHDFRPGAIGRALHALVQNRYVIVSTFSMAISFFAFIKLVAIAPMSFAVPMSAATFIPETILARFLLKERVDWQRWTGALLIASGVVFISQ